MIWTKYLLKTKISDESSLFLNTLTGAIDVIDESCLKENISEEIIVKLKRRGYIFDDVKSESILFEKLLKKYNSNENKHLQFVICPTYFCNLKCTYCFEGNLTTSKATLDKEKVEHIFNSIAELKKDARKCAIVLFGGEPLLASNKSLIYQIINNSRIQQIPISIVTNGTQLDKFYKIIKDNLDVIKSIQITLDGSREFNDKRRMYANGNPTFDLILRNFERYIHLKLSLLVRINVDLLNFSGLNELADLFQEKGWFERNNISFELAPLKKKRKETICSQLAEDEILEKYQEMITNKPETARFSINKSMQTVGFLNDIFNKSESNYGPKFHYCEACAGGMYVFSPEGNIYPCPESMGHENLIIGSFYPEFKLNDNHLIWQNRNINKIEKCKNCSIAPICGGGCSFEAFNKHGDPLMHDCSNTFDVIKRFMDKKAKEFAMLESKV